MLSRFTSGTSRSRIRKMLFAANNLNTIPSTDDSICITHDNSNVQNLSTQDNDECNQNLDHSGYFDENVHNIIAAENDAVNDINRNINNNMYHPLDRPILTISDLESMDFRYLDSFGDTVEIQNDGVSNEGNNLFHTALMVPVSGTGINTHEIDQTELDYNSIINNSNLQMNNMTVNEASIISESHDAPYEPDEIELNESFSDDNVVGRSGRKKPKKGTTRKVLKNYLINGTGKSVKPNPCEKLCQNKCSKKFDESQREDIFKFFWELDHERRRYYLLSCMKQVQIKRKRSIGESRRSVTNEYFLKHNSIEVQVCQQFLLKTLDVPQKLLRYTHLNKSPVNTAKKDRRGYNTPRNKTSPEQLQIVDKFIRCLPAVSSHYCRNKSNKKYLPTEFRNIANLYLIYKDYCTKKNEFPISSLVFRRFFKTKYSIGFHLPKKDKCKICEKKNENVNNNEEEIQKYNCHINLKEKAKAMFLSDQKKTESDKSFLCISFDLEKVLNTPYGNNMNFYYSRKYSQYNLTVYESVTKRVVCYLWGEGDANRDCNEIATCMHDYLMDIDKKKSIKTIALYCDSCCGQNKNHVMIGMLNKFINKAKYVTSVKITYLVPGHTYMPVDAIHSTIDNFLKNRTVWAPSEWPTLIANSRKNPGPLEVKVMKFNDFFDWKTFTSSVMGNTLMTDNKKVVKITKMKSVQFTKGEGIQVFFDYDEQFENIMIQHSPRIRKSKKANTEVLVEPQQLYSCPRKITSQKYFDLIKLCKQEIIPTRFHDEYKNLSHDKNILDMLTETDEEDDVLEEKD